MPCTRRMAPHKWGEWTSCPAAETREQELERARRGLRAEPGKFQVKMCSACGRVRVRLAKE